MFLFIFSCVLPITTSETCILHVSTMHIDGCLTVSLIQSCLFSFQRFGMHDSRKVISYSTFRTSITKTEIVFFRNSIHQSRMRFNELVLYSPNVSTNIVITFFYRKKTRIRLLADFIIK